MKGNPAATTPEEYIAGLPEPRRSEIATLDALIRAHAPNLEPSILFGMLAYGSYEYRYKTTSGTMGRICLASQKGYISLYAGGEAEGQAIVERFRERLPKANIGKSCIRLKRLSDVDQTTLVQMIEEISRTA